jgi:hypothetical protein
VGDVFIFMQQGNNSNGSHRINMPTARSLLSLPVYSSVYGFVINWVPILHHVLSTFHHPLLSYAD